MAATAAIAISHRTRVNSRAVSNAKDEIERRDHQYQNEQLAQPHADIERDQHQDARRLTRRYQNSAAS
jgi:hypothetical protein